MDDLVPLGTGVFVGFVLALCLHDYIGRAQRWLLGLGKKDG